MHITLDVIEINTETEYLTAFVDFATLAQFYGVEVSQIAQDIPHICRKLPSVLCNSVAQLFSENGVQIEDISEISMAFAAYSDTEGIDVNGVLVVASLAETKHMDLVTTLTTTLEKIDTGELQIVPKPKKVVDKVSAYSFIGTLTELEDMVVAGLLDTFTDTVLYKSGSKYELVATGPSDSRVAAEYMAKALGSHWKAQYSEHRVNDCVIKVDAVGKIKFYCNIS